MPCPLSTICNSLQPPALATIEIVVLLASMLFSSSSLTALAGRWRISPAAIRFTTDSSSLRMPPICVAPAGAAGGAEAGEGDDASSVEVGETGGGDATRHPSSSSAEA